MEAAIRQQIRTAIDHRVRQLVKLPPDPESIRAKLRRHGDNYNHEQWLQKEREYRMGYRKRRREERLSTR